MKKLCNNRGFSLIEVLIAITVLAIGLLAVAGMQTTAISGNSFAQSGTVAVHLTEEMMDRIRTNAGTNPGLYDFDAVDTGDSISDLQSALEDPAESDVLDWKSSLEASGLPNIVGTVSVSDGPIPNTATVTVTVSWGLNGTRAVTFTTILETWGT